MYGWSGQRLFSMEMWILHNKSWDCESITLLIKSIQQNLDLVCEDVLPVSFGFPGKVDCIEVPNRNLSHTYFDAVKELSQTQMHSCQ